MKKLLATVFALLLSCCAVSAQMVPSAGAMVPVSGPGVQANLTASTNPSTANDQTQGYQIGSIWQNASTGRIWIARSVATNAAVWDMLELSNYPGYLAGNWYVPGGPNGLNVGAAPGAGSIRLFPGFVKQRITINNLGLRITTLSGGGNVQAAVYANNFATMRPTGNALVSTASMSTTSTGSVSASASLQLEPGVMYWFATNCDNGTAVFTAVANANTWISAALGSSTQANDVGAGTGGQVGLTVSQTFGTWPDLTSGSFAELAGSGTIPIVQFQIASTP